MLLLGIHKLKALPAYRFCPFAWSPTVKCYSSNNRAMYVLSLVSGTQVHVSKAYLSTSIGKGCSNTPPFPNCPKKIHSRLIQLLQILYPSSPVPIHVILLLHISWSSLCSLLVDFSLAVSLACITSSSFINMLLPVYPVVSSFWFSTSTNDKIM